MGTWMQTTAQGFLIFQLTQSPVYLGYVGFANGLPLFFFTFFAGVVADRMSKRDLLVITQIVMMALAFIMAALTFSGLIQPWHIIIMAFALGTASAFDSPARQALPSQLVDRENLPNAIALTATMTNLGMAIGPAVGGLVYALLGPAWCFTINGVSFIAVITALTMMRLPAFVPTMQKRSVLKELKEGFQYSAVHPIIRILILNAAVTAVFSLSYATLFPAWAVNVLHGDATTNGFLQSARGIGSVAGAFTIAALGHFKFKGKLFTLGSFLFPGLMLAWSFVDWLPLSLVVLVGAGYGMLIFKNSANILVQTHVADELRGRVMAIYSVALVGMQPIGALLIGVGAELWGEPVAIAGCALVALVFAICLFLFVPKMRTLE
jgi:MFS family permease